MDGTPLTLESTPDKPGEYTIQCELGMLRTNHKFWR